MILLLREIISFRSVSSLLLTFGTIQSTLDASLAFFRFEDGLQLGDGENARSAQETADRPLPWRGRRRCWWAFKVSSALRRILVALSFPTKLTLEPIRFHLHREFFYLLSKELFNPDWGLFESGAKSDNYNTRINALSGMIDPEHHLQHFRWDSWRRSCLEMSFGLTTLVLPASSDDALPSPSSITDSSTFASLPRSNRPCSDRE